MRIHRSTVCQLGLLLVMLVHRGALAADISVIAAGAFGAVFKELGAEFERDTGHRLQVRISATSGVRKAVEAGEHFDVIVTSSAALSGWARSGAVVASTITPVVYTGLGLGVRQGAKRPDVGSVDAARRALRDATSIAHGAESASAVAFQTLLSRLGIGEELKPKLRPMGPGMQTKSVAAGETEMIVAVVPSIVAAQGVELAGVFPAELQTYITFSAAVSTGAKEADAARAVIELLTSSKARALYKSQGMEAGAP